MNRVATVVLIGVASLGAAAARHSTAASPHQVIAAAVTAAGGADALRAIRATQMTFVSEAYNVGQEAWPSAPAPLIGALLETLAEDYQLPAIWIRDTRLPPPNSTRIFTATGGVFILDSIPNRPRQAPAAIRPTGGIASLVRQNRLNAPDRLLLAALDAGPAEARALAPRRLFGRMQTGIEARLPADTVQLWFDQATHRLTAASFVAPDIVRGKLTPVETMYAYANWTRAGNVWLPWTTAMTVDGVLAQTRTVSALAINPTGIDTLFKLDPKFEYGSKPPVNLTAITAVNEVAPGVFRLEGVTHTPLAVVQGDSIILLEAPASTAFVHSILDSLKARFPRTPVKSFVVTHHHADHIAGIPAAFDAGLHALAPAELAEYVRGLGLAPNQKAGKPRLVTPIRDSMLVGSGPSRFVLYHVPSGHATALLMAYFPEPKLLFDIDLALGPPDDRQALFDFLRAHRLEVANLSRIHGPVMPWGAFIKLVPDTTRH